MRVLIADDHELLCTQLGPWFRKERIEVTLTEDLDSALETMGRERPFDLIVLDYGMPGMNGLNGLTRALGECNGARVAIMSGIAPREVAEQAFEMGAAGFPPKTLRAKSLVNAVRFMALGEQYAPFDVMTAAPETRALSPLVATLTARELDMLEMLCEGRFNKEVARARCPRTYGHVAHGNALRQDRTARSHPGRSDRERGRAFLNGSVGRHGDRATRPLSRKMRFCRCDGRPSRIKAKPHG